MRKLARSLILAFRTFHRAARTLAFAAAFLVTVLTSGSLLAATPTFFAPFFGPIGVAAAPGSLYVTRGCVNNTPVEVHSIDSAGNDTLIATIPNSTSTCEGYIAISPGLGGFTANDIYVTNGSEIWRVTPTGSSVTLFATLPLPAVGSHTGITFDHVGTFGFKMIVTTFDGRLFTIDSGANITLIASVPGALEGPDVAPLTFGPLGGQVFAADEGTHHIWAISASGGVTQVASFFAAESVHFIPDNVCSFGTSGGAFFSAIFPSAIYKFAPTDFTGLGGSMIVVSEGGGSSLLQFDTSTGLYTLSPFGTNVGQHEGSAFVDCAVPPINQPPVVSCTAATVPTDPGICTSSTGIGTSATDSDGTIASTSTTPAPPYPLGPTTVTFKATDDDGASSSCTAVVTVQDKQPPSITCSSPQTLECTGSSSASATVSAAAKDNCSVGVVSCSPGSGTFPLGTTPVSCSATDGSGNTSSCNSSVTVVDTTKPTVTAALVRVAGDDDDKDKHKKKSKDKKHGDGHDGDDDDEARFQVQFSCSDTCQGVTTTATLNGISVSNGQIVKLERDRKTEVEYEHGILKIEAPSFSLVVTCTDGSGNTGIATATPVLGNDDDHKKKGKEKEKEKEKGKK